MSRSITTPKQSNQGFRVVVRVRPVLELDGSVDREAVWVDDDQKHVIAGKEESKELRLRFSQVLGGDSSQDEVYDAVQMSNMVDASLKGFSTVVFAAGATGSGKTHSIFGPPGAEGDGLVFRSIAELYARLEEERLSLPEPSSSPMHHSARSWHVGEAERIVRVSFLEIYNEQVYDLLADAAGVGDAHGIAKPLPIRQRPSEDRANFFVPGQTIVRCDDAVDAIEVVRAGLEARAVAAHALNRDSSRSHALLTISVERGGGGDGGEGGDGGGGGEGGRVGVGEDAGLAGEMVFADLAGNERLNETHPGSMGRLSHESGRDPRLRGSASAIRAKSEAKREAGNINRSLHTLTRVLTMLARPGGETAALPLRDSALTKLLADALGGEALTCMLACVAPSPSRLTDSIRTLRLAADSTRVRNNPRPRETEHMALVRKLRERIAKLESENARLKAELRKGGMPSEIVRGRGKEHRGDGDEEGVEGEKFDEERSVEMVGGEVGLRMRPLVPALPPVALTLGGDSHASHPSSHHQPSLHHHLLAHDIHARKSELPPLDDGSFGVGGTPKRRDVKPTPPNIFPSHPPPPQMPPLQSSRTDDGSGKSGRVIEEFGRDVGAAHSSHHVADEQRAVESAGIVHRPKGTYQGRGRGNIRSRRIRAKAVGKGDGDVGYEVEMFPNPRHLHRRKHQHRHSTRIRGGSLPEEEERKAAISQHPHLSAPPPKGALLRAASPVVPSPSRSKRREELDALTEALAKEAAALTAGIPSMAIPAEKERLEREKKLEEEVRRAKKERAAALRRARALQNDKEAAQEKAAQLAKKMEEEKKLEVERKRERLREQGRRRRERILKQRRHRKPKDKEYEKRMKEVPDVLLSSPSSSSSSSSLSSDDNGHVDEGDDDRTRRRRTRKREGEGGGSSERSKALKKEKKKRKKDEERVTELKPTRRNTRRKRREEEEDEDEDEEEYGEGEEEEFEPLSVEKDDPTKEPPSVFETLPLPRGQPRIDRDRESLALSDGEEDGSGDGNMWVPPSPAEKESALPPLSGVDDIFSHPTG